MQIFGFLGSLLGYVLWGAFYLLKDFGLSIIVFTIIVRLCMFPFTIKQQKSMAGTARLSKKQKEIQEKYKNNRQKAQEEIYKLYEKEGVKPTGGCLTMIVPFLVLFGVFYAVAYPLTNTLHIDSAKVTEALNYVNTIPGYTAASGATNATYQEIYFLKDFSCFQNIDAIQQIFSADQLNTITMFEYIWYEPFRNSAGLRSLESDDSFPCNMFCIKRTYTVYHNENQRKEQSYAATAGLYEGYDVCNAAFLGIYRLHCSVSRCILLDCIFTRKPCSVGYRGQTFQPSENDSNIRSKTRRSYV